MESSGYWDTRDTSQQHHDHPTSQQKSHVRDFEEHARRIAQKKQEEQDLLDILEETKHQDFMNLLKDQIEQEDLEQKNRDQNLNLDEHVVYSKICETCKKV